MIKIICVGKIKENYIKAAIEDYYTRIKKYTNIQLIEVMDEKIEEEITTKRKDYVVTMEIEGEKMTSLSFAKFIDKTTMCYKNVTFIIGGSLGLDEEIKQRANKKISFSDLTFPHQLFRVLLLEQIYRSYKINHNENYHK